MLSFCTGLLGSLVCPEIYLRHSSYPGRCKRTLHLLKWIQTFVLSRFSDMKCQTSLFHCQQEVSDRLSTISRESIMRTYVSRHLNIHQKVDDDDSRSTASTDSWNTDDSIKLLNKLCHHQLHFHASLKSFIEQKET